MVRLTMEMEQSENSYNKWEDVIKQKHRRESKREISLIVETEGQETCGEENEEGGN